MKTYKLIMVLVITAISQLSLLAATPCDDLTITAVATCVGSGEYEVLVQPNYTGGNVEDIRRSWLELTGANTGITNVSTTAYAESIGYETIVGAFEIEKPPNGDISWYALNVAPIMRFTIVGTPNSCLTIPYTASFQYFSVENQNYTICSNFFSFDLYLPLCPTTQACGTLTDVQGCSGQDIILQYKNPNAVSSCDGADYIAAQTDENGNFCISIPAGDCVQLEIQNCGDPCGEEPDVSMLDVVALQRYILGLDTETGSSPYTAIFGDANDDGWVKASDLTTIRKEYLGITQSGIGDCLMFDPGNVVVGQNYWSGSLDVDICDGDDLDLIVGVLGDVNGSCTCDDGMKPEPTDNRMLEMSKVGNQRTFYLPEAIALQELHLEFELSAPITTTQVHVESLPGNYLKHVEGNTLKIAIFSNESTPISYSANEPMFTITLDDTIELGLNENSQFINADWERGGVEYTRRITRGLDDFNSTENVLYLNDNTLDLSSFSDLENVSIQVYDRIGREINVSLDQYSDLSNLNLFNATSTAGFYFVVINSTKGREVHKIVLLN